MSFTIGSLFDGSGGFPLAATMCGGTPLWASEVEPFPIAVTWSRFPNMKHLGSVTDVKGDEVEPVDVITFGSPCQDLSVAGKRAGLKHEDNGDEETTRSGLFMEAVRIIKEMRRATNGVYPRFAIWENVPGAFSSNKGEDFRTVCEELIKIVEPGAVMPAVPQKGWLYSDSYIGDGWSLAYRVFDAQYWGVPQRRRRIYLVVDFRGECAREILFEREGLRGYFAEGRTPWQGAAPDAQGCPGTDDRDGERTACIPINTMLATRHKQLGRGTGLDIGKEGDPQFAISTEHCHAVVYSFDSLASNSMKSSNPNSGCRQVDVAKTLDCFDPNPAKNQGGIAIVEEIVLDDQGGQQITVRTDGKSPTLRAEMHGNVPCVMEQHLFENHSQDTRYKGPLDVCPMLPAQLGTGGNNTPFVVECAPVYCLQGNGIDRADTAGCNGKGVKEDICYTLNTIDRPAVAFQTYQKVTGPLMANSHPGSYTGQDAFSDMLVAGKRKPNRYIVRRLTPTECARLQGFADRWAVPVSKDDFTDEEYAFWLNVRNTHAEINGKATKDYTKDQMLSWYNKLHTDSSEYKLWGNGIALPTALYVLQGIADVKED